PAALEERGHSLERAAFGSLDVDLDEVDLARVISEILVELDDLHGDRVPALAGAVEQPMIALVLACEVQGKPSSGVRDCRVHERHVRAAVQPRVLAEKGKVRRLRLEGEDTARIADELRKDERVVPDVRADVEDDVAFPHAALHEVGLERLPDALFGEDGGDRSILGIEAHAVAAKIDQR